MTGGNSGIGLAAASAVAAESARLCIVGRDAATLATAGAEIGEDILAVEANVSSLPEISGAFSGIGAAFGRFDVLFADAGTGAMMPFEQVGELIWDQVMGHNVKGTYFTGQNCLPLMGKDGELVLCSSVPCVCT